MTQETTPSTRARAQILAEARVQLLDNVPSEGWLAGRIIIIRSLSNGDWQLVPETQGAGSRR